VGEDLSGLEPPAPAGPKGGAEATLLGQFQGRWIAQDGDRVLYDAESAEAVVQWLRRHGHRARVWQVPSSSEEMGSAQSTP
jgi:hypothetical protein